MLLRTTRRLSSQFSRTAALEGKLARREASAAIQGAREAPKLSRADAIEGRLARREAAALLQGQAEAASLTRAEMIDALHGGGLGLGDVRRIGHHLHADVSHTVSKSLMY